MMKLITTIALLWSKSHPRTKVGAILSAFYLLTISAVSFFLYTPQPPIRINELGDFLAGVFAPLAFLWLVIGYFQQGEELRLNTENLALQVEELKQATAHAGGLLNVATLEHQLAREKLEAEKAEKEYILATKVRDQKEAEKRRIQPRFDFSPSRIGIGQAHILIENIGHTCNDFLIEIPSNEFFSPDETNYQPVFVSHGKHTLKVSMKPGRQLSNNGTTPIIVHWKDKDGDDQSKRFIASVHIDKIEINQDLESL
ncbi:MAG: hypothetical protein LBE58_12015 [Comamonas sp.]|jgi:hypothetical protein|nr:hypothetical protein [Comamonas sp.]